MITVYYDSRCGLCRREINHYKSIASGNRFIWKDAIDHADELEKKNVSITQALLALHAEDQTGTLHKGVDAFILIWSELPRWRWLSHVVRLPLIRPIARFAYRIFAEWKFKRSDHCQAVCDARVS